MRARLLGLVLAVVVPLVAWAGPPTRPFCLAASALEMQQKTVAWVNAQRVEASLQAQGASRATLPDRELVKGEPTVDDTVLEGPGPTRGTTRREVVVSGAEPRFVHRGATYYRVEVFSHPGEHRPVKVCTCQEWHFTGGGAAVQPAPVRARAWVLPVGSIWGGPLRVEVAEDWLAVEYGALAKEPCPPPPPPPPSGAVR